MMPDHARASRDARSWCNDEQSSTGNLARCYLELRERLITSGQATIETIDAGEPLPANGTVIRCGENGGAIR